MINIAVLDDELEIISEYEKQIPFLMQKNNVESNLIIATNLPSKFLDKVKSKIVNVCIIDITYEPM